MNDLEFRMKSCGAIVRPAQDGGPGSGRHPEGGSEENNWNKRQSRPVSEAEALNEDTAQEGMRVRIDSRYGGGTGEIVDFDSKKYFAVVEMSDGKRRSFSVSDLAEISDDDEEGEVGDAQWIESDHPRKGGKFAPKGQGDGGGGKVKTGAKETPSDLGAPGSKSEPSAKKTHTIK